jgi:hypothetical protein
MVQFGFESDQTPLQRDDGLVRFDDELTDFFVP